MMRFLSSRAVAVVAIACSGLWPAAADAQQDPPRPIFGQRPDTLRPMSLLNASVFGGAGTALAGAAADSGQAHLGLNAALSHVRRGRSFTFNADAGTSLRFLPTARQVQTMERSARAGLDKSLGRRSRFSVAQSLSYTPFRQFNALQDVQPTSAPETPVVGSAGPETAAAEGQPAYDLASAVSLSHELSPRTALGVSYGFRWHYADEADNLISHRLGLSLRLALGEAVALELGTATRVGQTSLSPQTTTAQEFGFGLDFRRPLMLGRGTVLNFTTGTAVISRSGTSTDANETGRRIGLIGTVGLHRTLSRNWDARIDYARQVRFIAALPDAFFADGVTGRVTGRFGRRVSLSLEGGHASGKSIDVGPEASDQFFRGLQLTSRMTSALSRGWQLYAEHSYSETHLSAAAQASLAPGVIPHRYGRGLRFGIELWAPRVH